MVSSFGSKVWQRQKPWKLRENPFHSFLILVIKPRLPLGHPLSQRIYFPIKM